MNEGGLILSVFVQQDMKRLHLVRLHTSQNYFLFKVEIAIVRPSVTRKFYLLKMPKMQQRWDIY